MKWHISFARKAKTKEVWAIAFLVSAAWFVTTLAFDLLLTKLLKLPAAADSFDRTTSYLLPQVFSIPLWIANAIFSCESKWKHQLFVRARWGYCALGGALLLWSYFVMLIGPNRNYRTPADTMEGAAYASILFPLALAGACFLLAIARRPARAGRVVPPTETLRQPRAE